MGGFCSGVGWGGWGGMGVVGAILSLVFLVGSLGFLGLGATWLVRQLGHRPARSEAQRDPLEIARKRLAAGEITVEEYDLIRGRLRLQDGA
jgi:uncharacterized membrane protein